MHNLTQFFCARTAPVNGLASIHSIMATPSWQQSTTTYMPSNLEKCDFVFVRSNAVKRPLTPSYQYHFKVLKHSSKHFTIKRNKEEDTVSIDQIKPAQLEEDLAKTNPSPTTEDEASITKNNTSTPVRQTRLGRRVHFPTNLKTYIFYWIDYDQFSRKGALLYPEIKPLPITQNTPTEPIFQWLSPFK